MEDKVFELMTKMYADITVRLDKMDKKIDGKADKTDIVLVEDRLANNSKALFDGYKQTRGACKLSEEKNSSDSTTYI